MWQEHHELWRSYHIDLWPRKWAQNKISLVVLMEPQSMWASTMGWRLRCKKTFLGCIGPGAFLTGCKDSLTCSLFQDINEMLLRLYYLYHNSPKKSKELEAIGEDLKQVYCIPKGGNLPVRCQGTRWINHKRRALQRIVDRYGVYIMHLNALVSDSTVKGVDRCKLRGYLLK